MSSRICFWIGDVERGRRLVGDQQLGLAGDRHRDHHPLLLAARQLRRKGVDPEPGIGNAHFVEELDRAPSRLPAGEAPVQPQHLGELEADREHRVERGHRLLEDHRQVGAAQRAQLRRREPDEVAPAVEDLAAGGDHRILRGQQPEDGERGHRLAAARLADQRDGRVARDVEADALHGLETVVTVRVERHAQVAHADQRLRSVRRTAFVRQAAGSPLRRSCGITRPSPSASGRARRAARR